MFGDLFSQRGNYLDGMIYQGRMKYLRDEDPTQNESAATLMPPDEFKTRRQLKHLNKTGSENNRNFQIRFQKKQDEDNHHHHIASRFKKSAHIIQDLIMFEHFSSNHEKDWTMTNEAGVVLWINKGTGEVSTVRPWGDTHTSHKTTPKMALLHPSVDHNSDGTNDIMRRIGMLKDHDADHKQHIAASTSASASASRSNSNHASPRVGIRPTSSTASPRISIIRPAASPSPRAAPVRHGDAKPGFQRSSLTSVSDAKGDHRSHSKSIRSPRHLVAEADAKISSHHVNQNHNQNHSDNDKDKDQDQRYGHVDEYLYDAGEASDAELGTGALVYDGSEVDDFFKLLDEMK